MTTLAITLPWPPSANTYWRNVVIRKRPRVLISKDGRKYRKDVASACLLQRVQAGLSGRLSVHLVAMPPDRRRRDLDNMFKASLDAITHAGVWLDDSQIDRLSIDRGEVISGGVLMVTVQELVESMGAA